MKRYVMAVLFGLSFVALSAALYLLHFVWFHDAHHIYIYLVGDIAFLPIEVLLVTIIIHRLLSVQEKRSRLRKLNMVIGAFFSEVGTEFIRIASKADPDSADISEKLVVKKEWTAKDFGSAVSFIRDRQHKLVRQPGLLVELRDFLVTKREFLLRLLENPNLLEHESFTDLLWAMFHLTEELGHRADLVDIPDSDRKHLLGDLERAYGRLIAQWLSYMRHLHRRYPYLFSLAARTNPFDDEASVVVT